MSDVWSKERLANLIHVLAGNLRAETGHFGPEIERLLEIAHDHRYQGGCMTCAVVALADDAEEALRDGRWRTGVEMLVPSPPLRPPPLPNPVIPDTGPDPRRHL